MQKLKTKLFPREGWFSLEITEKNRLNLSSLSILAKNSNGGIKSPKKFRNV
jgi:hypothetical protein